jgi:hypothetical protein
MHSSMCNFSSVLVYKITFNYLFHDGAMLTRSRSSCFNSSTIFCSSRKFCGQDVVLISPTSHFIEIRRVISNHADGQIKHLIKCSFYALHAKKMQTM